MNETWKEALRQQFGASIDMLENGIVECPDALWDDRSHQPEYWYLAFHTLFFLDLYLSGTLEGFAPPPPFTLDELDPSGIMPERPYSKADLLAYLTHCREKYRSVIDSLTDDRAAETCRFHFGEVTFADMVLRNIRHVQHHAAQLALILRQQTDSAPRWVGKTKSAPDAGSSL